MCIQEETCWGTAATSGQTPRGLDITGEALTNNQGTIESQIIRSDRMRPAPTKGNNKPGGSISGELQPKSWSIFLKHALGTVQGPTGSGPYIHTLLGAVDLPEALTIEKRFNFRSGEKRILRYLGSRVNTFRIGIPREGIVTVGVDVLSREERLVTSPLTASPIYLADNDPFNSFHGRVNIKGTTDVVATFNSANLLIANNIDGDQTGLDGTGLRSDLPEDLRSINGDAVAQFTDDSYELYQGVRDDTEFEVTLELYRGSITNKNPWWRFFMPACKLSGNAPQISGRGPIDLPITFDAFRDADLGYDIRCTIQNGESSIGTSA